MYLKYLTLILFYLSISSLAFAQCPTTNISFNTQADIDNFPINYPDCTMMPPGVSVSIGDSGDDLTDLNGLSGIVSIGGDLEIYSESLPNLLGLSGLTSIGGDFYIFTLSSSLTSLDGISNLTSVGGTLSMEFNDGLTNIDGLSALTSIGDQLHISSNILLANVDGLAALNSVSGHVTIFGYNDGLTNIDGLSALTSIGGNLSISSSIALTNVDGLSSLTTVGEYISISNNDVLTNVDGLSALTSAGGIDIGYNSLLTHVVIPNLASVGPIRIFDDAILTNIQFPSLATNLNEGLSINNNPLLTNLDGFSTVTSFGAGVYIQNNAALMNVDGLSGLTSIGYDLVIENNPQLSMCCALCPILQADADDDTVIGNIVNISGNATGCDETAILACTSCMMGTVSSDVPMLSEWGLIILGSNPIRDNLTIYYNLTKYLNSDIHIVDVTGKIICEIAHNTNDTNEVQVDISDLTSGFYFVRLMSGDTILSKKFVKQ